MSEIRRWLERRNLQQYADLFERHEIGVDVLGELTHDLLRDIGVEPLGHRLALLRPALESDPGVDAGPDFDPPPGHDENARPGSAPAPARRAATAGAPERRQLSILFCDLVGSTQISGMIDPEDYRDLMRLYQETVSETAVSYGGHVAKFLGDGVMIYFGYPTAFERAAERAVQAALRIIEAIAALRTGHDIKLQARIGIATGLVVVGDMIGRGVVESSVASGETPNLAARLQGVAWPDAVVIDGGAKALIGDAFRLESLGPQRLKGFAAPVAAWRVLGESEPEARVEARRLSTPSPLVGRCAEMDLLLGDWRAAAAGDGGRATLLSGEPGIGKSRLLEELEARIQSDAPVVLRYQGRARFANSALHPIRRQIKHAARFAAGDDQETRLDKLQDLLLDNLGPDRADRFGALFASLLSLPLDRFAPLRLSPALQKRRTIEAMVEQVEVLAAERPVLLLFEDAHWVDPTTLEAFDALMRRLPDLRVHLVVSFRPEFEPAWVDMAHVRRCDLGRLTTEDSARIIAHVAAGASVPGELRRTLLDRTDGIPLFVEELTRYIVRRDAQAADGDLERDGEHVVPATLQDSLMARLDRLQDVREVAQIGAVIGREFDLDLLSAISGWSGAELRAALVSLEREDLVTRLRSQSREAWMFRHALVQDAAYQSILKRNRQALHESIARTMVASFPERCETEPEYVAYHFSRAGLGGEAAAHWLAAGQGAWRRAAAKEALAHLGQGLAHVGAIAARPERETLELKLQSTLGVVHFAATSYASPQAQAAFMRARALCDTVGNLDLRFAVLYGLGAFETMKGDLRAGESTIDQLCVAADAASTPRYQVYAASMLAWSHYNRGRFRDSLASARALAALYDQGAWAQDGPRLSAADPRVISDSFSALALWAIGRADQATRACDAVLDYARELNDPYSLVYAYSTAGVRIPDLTGQTELVLERADAGTDMARDFGYDFLGVFTSFWRARALSKLGETGEAVQVSQAALKACQSFGVGYHMAHFTGNHARILMRDGRMDEALATLEGLDAMAARTGERSQEAETHIIIAEVVQAALGDAARAEREYRKAMDVARRQQALGWDLRARLGLSRLLAANGQQRRVGEVLRPACDAVTEGLDTSDVHSAREMLKGVA